ncbi:MAG: SOS response-associated peptidase [Planctomycetota bacterium]
MCGRFTLTNQGPEIAEYFDIREVPRVAIVARYNIAPTQPVLIARAPQGRDRGELAEVVWGLVPSWSNDATGGAKMINARGETVDSKPAFREAFRKRRCIVPASGFYEWTAAGKRRQPWYITLTDQPLMPLAGLWEQWRGPDGKLLETCTIITTSANELMTRMHDRMPVILSRGQFAQWLDPDEQDAGKLKQLIASYDTRAMTMHAVSMRVNNARLEDGDPTLIDEVDHPGPEAPPQGRQLELF